MNKNLSGNETKKHGSLTKEEINVLFKNDEERASQEEKSLSDYFNEIVKLDDRAIQIAIQKTGGHDLAKALKTTSSRVQNKIFGNMTKRASTMLKEEIEYMGPVRLRDVEEVQHKFLLMLHNMIKIGEITVPEDFLITDNLPISSSPYYGSNFTDIEEFAVYLTNRGQREEVYGHSYSRSITMRRFFETKNNENILADIEQTNREQNMGNIKVPNTKIKLINFSICPKCAHIFSFKELIDYYANPEPDNTFKNRAEQYREDTRVLCHECKTYFLPALVITDGTPKNEVQFLCRVQTTNSIDGSNYEKGDVLFGAWQ